MNPNWQYLNQITTGGTILGLTEGSKGRLWAITSAGLFQKDDHGWFPKQTNLPFPQVTAINQAGKLLFTGGLTGDIAYSLDGGDIWHKAWIDQVQSPISCFVLSPSYQKDHVLLAGTQGEGILRTTDGGRHWQLENFGLQGFFVFDLAAITVKETFRELNYTRDFVFAGTDDGVYFSPNGGRAWKPAGLETAGKVILTLAISTSFNEDKTIYAGSETGEIFRSQDGGESWQKLTLGQDSNGAINCINCGVDGYLLAGTSQGGILGSKDRGQSWKWLIKDVPPVLILERIGGTTYAGFYQLGMMMSDDGGESWSLEETLTARRFEWLEAPSSDRFIAAGPEEGIWISDNQGRQWSQLTSWVEDKVILGIIAGEQLVLVAAPDGIYRSSNSGEDWNLVLGAERVMPSTGVLSGRCHFTSKDDHIWFGGEDGQLWHSEDLGQSWQALDTAFSGMPIIMLAAAPPSEASSPTGKDVVLVAGILEEPTSEVHLWCMDLDGNWSLWQSEETTWYSLMVSFAGKLKRRAILGLGTKVLEGGQDNELEISLEFTDKPITALAVAPDGSDAAVAAFDLIHYRSQDGDWELINHSHPGEAVVAMRFSPKFKDDRSLFVLTSTGKFCKVHIRN